MQNQTEAHATTALDSNITQLNLSKAVQPHTKTMEELLDSITTMDCISQSGFGHIRAIASLAKQAVKSSQHGHLDANEIAGAFEAIRSIADDMMNDINCEAETSGANYVGE
jgi:methyl-accepting chemotaxis protein